VGVTSNRAAIGARIHVTVENPPAGNAADRAPAARSIYRTGNSGGSFGANPMEQHVGLGPSARIKTLEIWWPASDTRQTFSNVTANQSIEIKELATGFTTLERKSYRLGGPDRAQ